MTQLALQSAPLFTGEPDATFTVRGIRVKVWMMADNSAYELRTITGRGKQEHGRVLAANSLHAQSYRDMIDYIQTYRRDMI